MALHFRHDSPRPGQRELMEDMQRAINFRQIIIAHAPTGSGKTDASLSAAVSCAIEQDLDVLFLTSKISQHRIAMDVVRGLEQKHHLGLRAVDMVGRAHCCIDDSLRGMDSEGLLSACIKKRQNAECIFYGNARGYSRREEIRAEAKFRDLLENYGSGKSHHEMIENGRSDLCCPYEWLLKLAAASRVVVADYHHVFMPHIRDIFLQKIRKRIENSIIIVDEAHNLAPRIRSSLSRNVSTFLFARVAKEMRSLGLDAGPLEEEFRSWGADALSGARERVVSPEDFTSFIGRFGLGLEEAVQRLEDAGNAYVEKAGRKSACLRLARFLDGWEGEDGGCVRILREDKGHLFLSKRMLDPSSATRILNDCAASILMSGSMLPMEMHRDVLGLDRERTIMKAYPSPFCSSNIVNIISEGLTTRYTRRGAEEYGAIASKIDAIVARTPGGTAVFFPSYEVMDSVLPLVLSRNLHIQRPQMRPGDIRKMLRDFRSGGVLVGVQGGSLSEGVDYCEGEIKTVVIVGVALEEMGLESRALIDYYDAKFGRGWDYGYLYPGTIKALQAAGRARRKESDRVAVVYMDERFKWNKYNWILSRDEKAVVTGMPEDAVGEFWECENAADREIRPEKAR
ncbi:ATP-dependent DNA helicase [Candidatus Micrarchaeota archaeon]|nr:ATP-dependent DNA helicase [Candidatus Micrarchaeota archaeon]